jgi:hypothetical protein
VAGLVARFEEPDRQVITTDNAEPAEHAESTFSPPVLRAPR